MLDIRTHTKIDKGLSGFPEDLKDGFAVVRLETTDIMAADEFGLVHGGFLFSSADYAAMLAVNEPTVVLAKAEVKFLKPVRVGEEVIFTARVEKMEGKKIIVSVRGEKGGASVFEGEFLCIVPEKHVLEKI